VTMLLTSRLDPTPVMEIAITFSCGAGRRQRGRGGERARLSLVAD
jgi:hypothetical protein